MYTVIVIELNWLILVSFYTLHHENGLMSLREIKRIWVIKKKGKKEGKDGFCPLIIFYT